MNLIVPAAPMTVDEFLAWAAGREGKHELSGGIVYTMPPERVDHVRVKQSVYAALRTAINQANLPCEALGDGMTVRIDNRRAFVPDALVHCQTDLPGESVEVSEPLVIVEVTSPSSNALDTGGKLAGYFRLPSLVHYLVVDVEGRSIIHHRRKSESEIETRIGESGVVRLDPPGLDIAIEQFFEDL